MWYAPSHLWLAVAANAVGEAGLPLPIILEGMFIAAGNELGHGHAAVLAVVPAAIGGSVIGASTLYAVARSASDWVLAKFPSVERQRSTITHQLKQFGRWQVLGLTVLRLTPGLLIPTTILSGILNLPYRSFLGSLILSGVVYAIVFLLLGVLIAKGVVVPHLIQQFFLHGGTQ